MAELPKISDIDFHHVIHSLVTRGIDPTLENIKAHLVRIGYAEDTINSFLIHIDSDT